MKKTALCFTWTVLVFVLAAPAALASDWEKYDKPVPTKVWVRVLAHGAKSMSEHTGALVVIRDARTGKELDRGVVEGDTGDNTAMMMTGYPRITGMTGAFKGEKGMLFEDPKAKDKAGQYFDIREGDAASGLKPVVRESPVEAAVFETVLAISKPTQIVVEAYGPLMPQHSMSSAVTSAWVFPGEEITGEGIVLELRGLIVDVRASMREMEIKLSDVKDRIDVPFFMRMLCGCPIAPKGRPGVPWEAEVFKITTQAYYKGELYYEETTSSDKLFVDVSSFLAHVPLPKNLPGGEFKKEQVKVRVMASQPGLGNYGLDEFNVYLSK